MLTIIILSAFRGTRAQMAKALLLCLAIDGLVFLSAFSFAYKG